MSHRVTVTPPQLRHVLLPVMSASGRGCSFLHSGMNTVMSRRPLSQNQFTANCSPWHENTFLSPWLKKTQKPNSQKKKKSNFFFFLFSLFQEADCVTMPVLMCWVQLNVAKWNCKNKKAHEWDTVCLIHLKNIFSTINYVALQNKWRFLTQKHHAWQCLLVAIFLMFYPEGEWWMTFSVVLHIFLHVTSSWVKKWGLCVHFTPDIKP